MKTLPSFFCLLFLYLGCFIFSTQNRSNKSPKLPKTSNSFKQKTTKALSSSWSFLKRAFHKPDSIPNPPPSPPKQPEPGRISQPGPEISSEAKLLPLRNDIYPCPTCGEIFQKPNLLGNHQARKHAVFELLDGDSSKNIIQIIFNSGWPIQARTPTIHRVMKIQNSPKTLTRFEDYRERVKMNAAVRRRDERCIADGNELLRFHCATFMCDLGENGNSSVCDGQYCSLCGIIKSGISSKMDGISTWSSGWRGHMAVPEEIEEEFGFMNVKRAMLLCRVIAGRIGRGAEFGLKEDPGFDSVVGNGVGLRDKLDGNDELLVFNSKAVLPCFVIVYTV